MDIEENLKEDNIASFLNMLVDLGHESPIEHVNFTFGVEGVSRTLTHQLVRHRSASDSQQSQRYVKVDRFEYIIPPAIKNNEKARELFIESTVQYQKCYNELSNILFHEHYNKYIKEGNTEKEARRKAEKEAIEDARYVFPNACETKIIVTMNARSLLHFFNKRCCNRAQDEIRNLATEMLKLVKTVAPNIFKYAGPTCLQENCPEGNMTCGNILEVGEFFNKI